MGGLVRGGDGLVLNKYRSLADPYLNPLAKRMSGVSPDLLTWVAFLFAILAGASYYLAGEVSHHLLLLAFLAVVLNALFDALDGWVARITGKASLRGDFLDHVLDRYADAFIIGGIVLSAYSHITVGLLALFGVIFTSYMGTQSMALGLARNYGGILGRADRLVLLILATLGQWVWTVYSGEAHVATLDVAGDPYHITVLEVLLVWFALAGNVTAVQRGTVAWRDLTKLQEEGSDVAPSEAVTVEVVEESTSREEEGEEGAESVEEEDTVEEEDGEIEEQEDLPKASKRG